MTHMYMAGHRGLVGSHVAKLAKSEGFQVSGKPSSELDFRNRDATFSELTTLRPDILIIAAAVVGGIGANSEYPVKFLSENLQIQCNLIDAAHAAKVRKVVFLGSSCIYPKLSKQPILEDYLLTGELESTNQPYALAKIAGIELINSYRKEYGYDWTSVMPCNLYGPNDNFDLQSSHVLAALIRKIHEAKSFGKNSVSIWGDGTPLREFLYVEDAAKGILQLVRTKSEERVYNLGSEKEISIRDLALLIGSIVGYEGTFDFDNSKPNGTHRKLMSSERLRKLGWGTEISLEEGILKTYEWYVSSMQDLESIK
jgi:GDP-L-fucose synthase